jgi:cytochrome P450
MLMLSNRTRPPGPSLALDLYSREAFLNPHETYRRIREAGATVWLQKHRLWAIGRFRDVREALRDDETFRSGKGVAANRLTNAFMEGTTLASDSQTHTNRRRVLLQSLSAKALAEVDPTLQHEASALTRRLLQRDKFDGVSEFASHLPVRVVADLVGVDMDHTRMLRWARSGFDGPPPTHAPKYSTRRPARSLPAAAVPSLRALRGVGAAGLSLQIVAPAGSNAPLLGADDDGADLPGSGYVADRIRDLVQ